MGGAKRCRWAGPVEGAGRVATAPGGGAVAGGVASGRVPRGGRPVAGAGAVAARRPLSGSPWGAPGVLRLPCPQTSAEGPIRGGYTLQGAAEALCCVAACTVCLGENLINAD